MAKMTYKEQLLNPKWKEKRSEILNQDNFTCQYCGTQIKSLHVHHLYYEGMAWEVQNDGLITLCSVCHKIEHLVNLTELEKEIIFIIRMAVQFGECKDNAANCISQKINNSILNHKANG